MFSQFVKAVSVFQSAANELLALGAAGVAAQRPVSRGASVAGAYENGTEVGADVAVDARVHQYGASPFAGLDTRRIATSC